MKIIKRVLPVVKKVLRATLSIPCWRNTRRALQLNGMLSGETVFIIGSGPQLNSLCGTQIERLKARATIGLNRAQYKVPLRFFLSGYPAEVLLARRACSEGTLVVHMRSVYEAPLFPGIITLKREQFEPERGLNTKLNPVEPRIFSKFNVALGATHLALILGAKRIVYLGVEQRNALHFYDEDLDCRQRIRDDLRALPHRDLFTLDHRYANYEALMSRLHADPRDLRDKAFFNQDHTPTFQAYFSLLAQHGVEVYGTQEDSVVCAAGASYRPLERILEEV